MSIVSNNIKYLRRLNGLTQEQFARRIGIKRSLLGAYEEARANPNLDNLMAIARAFHTTVDNLLKQDLRKIRETPDLSLPLDGKAESLGGVPSPLGKDIAEPEPPKPLAAVLDHFYHGPAERSPAERGPAERAHIETRSRVEIPVERPNLLPERNGQDRASSIRLVAQRIMPRPISHRDGIGAIPYASPAPSTPPAFNNRYESTPAYSPAVPPAEEVRSQAAIQLVRHSQWAEYQTRYQQLDFLNRLPTFQLPLLPPGHYRAFEAGEDFTLPGALLIGQFVRNWYEIADGRQYVLLMHQGLQCRRVFNQVKTKGTLLLTADQPVVPSREVPIRDVLEVWEVKGFFSQQLPEPAPSLDRVRSLVDDLRFELERMKS